jgi:hypothetical protein
MQKRHLHTTLSLKHAKLLDTLEEKYGSKQKALELALEGLEHNNVQPPLSPEEEYWMRIIRESKTVGIIQKEIYKFLLSTIDIERFKEMEEQQKAVQFVTEFYYQKPLKECSLKEVMDGLVFNSKFTGLMDSLSYIDYGDHYRIKIIHDMGLNNSKWLKIMYECLFKEYGACTEFTISDRSLFINVYKNNVASEKLS